MSDRSCNYCTFQRLEKKAKEADMVVTKQPSYAPLGGVDIYVHPPYIVPTEAFWKRWYMSLPSHCCC